MRDTRERNRTEVSLPRATCAFARASSSAASAAHTKGGGGTDYNLRLGGQPGTSFEERDFSVNVCTSCVSVVESPGIREIATFDLPKNVDVAALFCERTTLNDDRSNLMMIGV